MNTDPVNEINTNQQSTKIDERRSLWRYDVGSVYWEKYDGLTGGRMIPCGGATGSVDRQGRRRNLPQREV